MDNDNYILKLGEVLNGGYTLQINDFILRIIGGYEPAWENVYDTDNSFTDWQGNTKKIFMGERFSIKIATGQLDIEDYNALVEALRKDTIYLSCPDFEGECYCDNIPSSLEQANFLNTRYKTNVTLTAKELIKPDSGGGL